MLRLLNNFTSKIIKINNDIPNHENIIAICSVGSALGFAIIGYKVINIYIKFVNDNFKDLGHSLGPLNYSKISNVFIHSVIGGYLGFYSSKYWLFSLPMYTMGFLYYTSKNESKEESKEELTEESQKKSQ